MNKVVAVIPIKTNNQRLPGKNTKLLGKYPLYHYMFKTVSQVEGIDKIWVDSSDRDILNIALENRFNTMERPKNLNLPETSGHDLLKFEIDMLHLDDNDILVQLFVTQPFIKSETLNSAVELLKNNPNKTSVLALFEVENRFWYDGKPISHNPKLLEGTQYQKPIYCEAGFYVFRVGDFKKEGARVTDDFIEMIVDSNECVDIDTQTDFNYAEVIVNADKKI